MTMTHESHTDVDTGADYGTHKSYVIGFLLSIGFTLVAFYLVANAALPPKTLYITVGILALIQLLVQVVFFLHLNARTNSSWNLLSFAFAVLMVLIMVIGTMWIMYNLYANMGMNSMSM